MARVAWNQPYRRPGPRFNLLQTVLGLDGTLKNASCGDVSNRLPESWDRSRHSRRSGTRSSWNHWGAWRARSLPRPRRHRAAARRPMDELNEGIDLRLKIGLLDGRLFHAGLPLKDIRRPRPPAALCAASSGGEGRGRSRRSWLGCPYSSWPRTTRFQGDGAASVLPSARLGFALAVTWICVARFRSS